MTDRELMQMVLDALYEVNKLSVGERAVCLPGEIDTAMEALRERLSQPEPEPEPEPVAWRDALPGGRLTDKWESARIADYNAGWNDYRKAAKEALEKLYTAPPKREWVGLTLEEVNQCYEETVDEFQFAQIIEAKLKDKNGG